MSVAIRRDKRWVHGTKGTCAGCNILRPKHAQLIQFYPPKFAVFFFDTRQTVMRVGLQWC